MYFIVLKAFFIQLLCLVLITPQNCLEDGKLIFRPLEHQPRIYQGAPPGVHVTTVHAYNPDSPRNKVRYLLTNAMEHDYFILDPNSGNLTTAKIIEKEVGDSYHIMVSAVSSGLSEMESLDIAVTEFNQFAPRFGKRAYKAELSLHAEMDSSVLQVHATDADNASHNAEVYYKMDQNLSTYFFNLNSTTGELTVARPLNTTQQYLVFGIFAEDGGSPRRWDKAQVKIVVKSISVPLEVVVSNITTTSAVICWMPPDFGFIAGYILYYRLVGVIKYNTVDVNSGPLRTCTTLSKLLDGRDYAFRLSAVNPDENGQRTDWKNFKTIRNPCSHIDCIGGDCVAIENVPYYECLCHQGFYGQQCEYYHKCNEKPCGNGTCYMTDNDHFCVCPDGSLGHNCSSTNTCDMKNPACRNGDPCEVVTDKNYGCFCEPDFYGPHCENRNPCYSQPCFNFGTCTNISDDSFTCSCLPGFTGKMCDHDIDECAVKPCGNGSICFNNVGNFSCICPYGYTGHTCNKLVQCLYDETKTIQGILYWNATDHGSSIITQCPQGSLESPQLDKFAERECILFDNGTVAWGEINDTACKRTEFIAAEQIAGDLRSLTNDPSIIDTKQLQDTTQKMETISSYAAQDKKIAKDVVSTISNVLNANTSVIEDENGTISENLVHLVDNLAENVPLERGEKSCLETENIQIHTMQWHPEVDDEDEFGVLKFDLFEAKPSSDESSPHKGDTSMGTSEPATNFSITSTPLFTVEPTTAKVDKEEAFMQVYVPRQALEEVHQKTQKDVRVKCVVYSNDKFFQTKKEVTNSDVNKSDTVSDEDTASTEGNEEENDLLKVPVLQISVGNIPLTNLTQPLVYIVSIATKRKASCVYWKEKERKWDTEGVTTNQTNKLVICESTHLTAFSVLLDPTPQLAIAENHESTLFLISVTGCSLSVLGLVSTIITYSIFRSLNRDRQGKILLNLSISLLLLNLTFLVGAFKTPEKGDTLCIVIAALLHYFTLTSLAWMMVEAVNMYQLLIHVFATAEERFMLKRCVLAWLIPLVVVAIPLATNFDAYNNDQCVISPNNPWIYYGSFFVPSCTIIIINTCIFFMVARVLFARRGFCTRTESFHPSQKVTTAQFRGAFTVMILLGATWVLGSFAIGDMKLTFQYAFCILNPIQGFLIFLVRCLLYPEARISWGHFFKHGKFKKHRGVNPPGGISWSTCSNTIIRQQSNQSAIYRTSTIPIESTSFVRNIWNRIMGRETSQNRDMYSRDVLEHSCINPNPHIVPMEFPELHFETFQNETSTMPKGETKGTHRNSRITAEPSVSATFQEKGKNTNMEREIVTKDDFVYFNRHGYDKSDCSANLNTKSGASIALKKHKTPFVSKENQHASVDGVSPFSHLNISMACFEDESNTPCTKFPVLKFKHYYCTSKHSPEFEQVGMPSYINSNIYELKPVKQGSSQEKKSFNKIENAQLSPTTFEVTCTAAKEKHFDGESSSSTTTDIDEPTSVSPNIFNEDVHQSSNKIHTDKGAAGSSSCQNV